MAPNESLAGVNDKGIRILACGASRVLARTPATARRLRLLHLLQLVVLRPERAVANRQIVFRRSRPIVGNVRHLFRWRPAMAKGLANRPALAATLHSGSVVDAQSRERQSLEALDADVVAAHLADAVAVLFELGQRSVDLFEPIFRTIDQ